MVTLCLSASRLGGFERGIVFVGVEMCEVGHMTGC